MARYTIRTVPNLRGFADLRAGLSAGMAAMGQAFVDRVHPPDAAPFGVGLVQTPAFGVWEDGKKVAGEAVVHGTVEIGAGITLIAGEGFPGRFQELGTVKMAPNPHVTPVAVEIFANPVEEFLKPHVRGGR